MLRSTVVLPVPDFMLPYIVSSQRWDLRACALQGLLDTFLDAKTQLVTAGQGRANTLRGRVQSRVKTR